MKQQPDGCAHKERRAFISGRRFCRGQLSSQSELNYTVASGNEESASDVNCTRKPAEAARLLLLRARSTEWKPILVCAFRRNIIIRRRRSISRRLCCAVLRRIKCEQHTLLPLSANLFFFQSLSSLFSQRAFSPALALINERMVYY